MGKEVFILDKETLRNLVFIYFLLHPNMTGRRIFAIWYKSNLFSEYNRPEEDFLVQLINEYKEELTPIIVQRKSQMLTA